ncbi:hypothetical protein F4861DRAFT_424292 [Xylaria intraflava]|nr:hypothetical protein F4861DRAFT_424292 [Xylaria intraflava]
MRVKYETLQAANKIVEVGRWAEKLTVKPPAFSTTTTDTLVDLAPGIVRNICAGASTWIFRRIRGILCTRAREEPQLTTGIPNRVLGDENAQTLSREHVGSLMESAVMLRNVAATATSHKDAEGLVERLNKQIGPLEGLVNTDEGRLV